MTVLISDYFEYHRLAAYLQGRTAERIGMVMGVPSLSDLFDEKNHTQLPGGILESFGRLFKNDLKLFVYPKLDQDGQVVTVDDLLGRAGAAAAVRLPGRPWQLRATWTATAPSTCRSTAATCCTASPPAATRGRPWCPSRSPT